MRHVHQEHPRFARHVDTEPDADIDLSPARVGRVEHALGRATSEKTATPSRPLTAR